jgi:hypothetical protein
VAEGKLKVRTDRGRRLREPARRPEHAFQRVRTRASWSSGSTTDLQRVSPRPNHRRRAFRQSCGT